jgi:molybdopterin molybdotransferase
VISVDETLAIVIENAPRLEIEEVDFEQTLGRVLAEDVASDLDLPPFDRSSVDGFALRSRDVERVPAWLRLVGTVGAGEAPAFEVGEGEAAQVMTGAPVPRGADAIEMVERVTLLPDFRIEVKENVARGQNVAPRGQEATTGQAVLRAGTRLDAAGLAVLATVGKVRVRVGRQPKVAVAATGNELVAPSEKPGPGRIRNSNGFSLAAQARSAGASVTYLGVAVDDQDSIAEVVQRGLRHDVLLLSGGVSMGLLDLVEDVLLRFDVKILVNAVALKPGKPLVFGVGPAGALVFGLPGNPVSTAVTFELFVRSALARMEGCERVTRPYLTATLTAPLSSKGPRRAYLPGWLTASPQGLAATPVATRGSADIVAFSKANALLVVPEEHDRLEAGSPVAAWPLDNFFFKEDRWALADPVG